MSDAQATEQPRTLRQRLQVQIGKLDELIDRKLAQLADEQVEQIGMRTRDCAVTADAAEAVLHLIRAKRETLLIYTEQVERIEVVSDDVGPRFDAEGRLI